MEAALETVQPPLFRRHARRPRLTRLLDESRAQAILMTAPAGYGKTTLAMEWLQSREKAAWYRATNASADLAAFSAGVADVVAPLVPGAGDRLKQRLRVADTPERAARPLAELLAEDLSPWPEDGLLVVDDYHLVADSTPVEDFFDWLLTLAPQLHVLVATRRRPRWASARRILYGEITEIGREQLAMNNEEAARVLDDRSTDDVRALVMQAEGWPALIGLAALTASREIPAERVSDALYRYFAEEVVRREPPEVERFMLLASVPAALDERVAKEVLQIADPGSTLERLVDEGLLHTDGVQFRFHPLLRTFLRRRLEAQDPETCRDLVDRAIEDARQDKRWEEGFTLAIDGERFTVALEILEHAAQTLLAGGRIETLERWLSECGPAGINHPGAVLARAEILIRHGRFSEASALAEDLAQTLPTDHRLASRVFLAAGQARYLRSQNEPATKFYARANELASGPEERGNALWGAFLAEIDSDVEAARVHLEELSSGAATDLNTRLRVATGLLTLASHAGSFRGVWDITAPLLPLVGHATDPLVRSNFVAQAAYLAIARADYDTAATLASQALEESSNLKHGFATGSCLAYRTAAEIGRRKLEAAKRDLRELSRLRAREEDPYLQTEFVLMQVRLAIATGDLSQAWSHASSFPPDAPDRATRGEHLGMASIVLAALGENEKAMEFGRSARELTQAVEARFYARFAEALIGRDVAEVADAFHDAREADFLEAFVLAYRASPKILELIANDPALVALVRPIVARARDEHLASKSGLGLAENDHLTPKARSLLTPRESEVLTLLGEGLTNADIADRLFISESTAKVHVHHILEKLNVKTRLQAALVAQRAED